MAWIATLSAVVAAVPWITIGAVVGILVGVVSAVVAVSSWFNSRRSRTICETHASLRKGDLRHGVACVVVRAHIVPTGRSWHLTKREIRVRCGWHRLHPKDRFRYPYAAEGEKTIDWVLDMPRPDGEVLRVRARLKFADGRQIRRHWKITLPPKSA